MPLDPSISLQTQAPNPTNLISSFLDLGAKKLNLDKAKATYDADVAGSIANSQTAQANADVATQTVPSRVNQAAAESQYSQFKLTGAQAQQSMQLASGLAADPDFDPKNPNPDGMLTKLNGAYDTMVKQFGVDPKIADATVTTLKNQALHSPQQVQQSLINMTQQQQGGAGQQAAAFPSPVLANTGNSLQPVAAGNQKLTGVAPGTSQGVSTPTTISPGQNESVETDAQGNRYIVQRGPNGVVLNTRQVPGTQTGGAAPGSPPAAGPVNLPPGETNDSRANFVASRDASTQAAATAGIQHNLNRSVIGLVDQGTGTGTFNQGLTALASKFGFAVGSDSATNMNELGKFLEKSALTSAQTMGPHTNAGLEAQVRANGSLDYTPDAIRRIAALNDALATGTTMYAQGVQAATATAQNPMAAKRNFDLAWGNTMDPDALRLKNAVDNKDAKEQALIIKQVGGPGSPGAKQLFNKLQQIDALSTTGQLPR